MIKAGAKILLDQAGNVIGLALPLTLVGTLVINPGIVQDVSEGPPRILINGEWHQLTTQEAALLRTGQPIDVDGTIVSSKEVIARINGKVDIAGNSNLADPNGGNSQFNDRSQVTPPVPEGTVLNKDTIEGELRWNNQDDPRLRELMSKFGWTEAKGEPPRMEVEYNGVKYSIPYYKLGAQRVTPEQIRDFVNTARQMGFPVKLHVGPRNTIDPYLEA